MIQFIDRKSTRLNSSHGYISYAVFCLKKKIVNIGHDDAGRPLRYRVRARACAVTHKSMWTCTNENVDDYLTVSSTPLVFFFFNDTATTEIYTLSLHDALPIFIKGGALKGIPFDSPVASAQD